ncbi:hypothetical protein COOONC_26848 [Cooperia oncophora]
MEYYRKVVYLLSSKKPRLHLPIKVVNLSIMIGPDDPYRGNNGPLYVTRGHAEHPLHQAFLEAGRQHPIGNTEDMNGFKQGGVLRNQWI